MGSGDWWAAVHRVAESDMTECTPPSDTHMVLKHIPTDWFLSTVEGKRVNSEKIVDLNHMIKISITHEDQVDTVLIQM